MVLSIAATVPDSTVSTSARGYPVVRVSGATALVAENVEDEAVDVVVDELDSSNEFAQQLFALITSKTPHEVIMTDEFSGDIIGHRPAEHRTATDGTEEPKN
ncbi:hypothetical protein ACQBAR_15900 [Propionibacteriaceae bacterium Y1685]